VSYFNNQSDLAVRSSNAHCTPPAGNHQVSDANATSAPRDTREIIPIVVVFRVHSRSLPMPNAEDEKSAEGHRLHLVHRPHRLIILIVVHAAHTTHLITIIRIIPRIIHILLRGVFGNILYKIQSVTNTTKPKEVTSRSAYP